MVKIHLGDTPNSLSEHDFDTLGRLTEGASGSDITVLVKEALMEPLRRCQQAKQFKPVGEFLMPCEEYPNCPYCPMKLSTDKPNKDYTCKKCGAQRMQLWDVSPDKLKAPDISVKDFENVLRHSHSTVSEDELEEYTKWTTQFGQEGA
jgi:vacuolar protein-sorting-associated protein 4